MVGQLQSKAGPAVSERPPYHRQLPRSVLRSFLSVFRLPFSVLRLWFAILCLLLGVTSLHAHPLHTALAEADYRPDSGKLEIALRLFSDDTEDVLSKRMHQKISIDKTPRAELEKLLAAYVGERFLVRTKAGPAAAFTWIGYELKDADQHLWLYFECSLPGGIEGVRFANRMLREEFSDQLNSVLIRDHSPNGPGAKTRQLTLIFTDEREQPVIFPRP